MEWLQRNGAVSSFSGDVQAGEKIYLRTKGPGVSYILYCGYFNRIPSHRIPKNRDAPRETGPVLGEATTRRDFLNADFSKTNISRKTNRLQGKHNLTLEIFCFKLCGGVTGVSNLNHFSPRTYPCTILALAQSDQR